MLKFRTLMPRSILSYGMIFTLICMARLSWASPLLSDDALESWLSSELGLETKLNVANCADFSGVWQGSCTMQPGGVKKTRTMSIEVAGCSMLILNGEKYPIMGSRNESIQGPAGTVSPRFPAVFQTTMQVSWNEDRTSLSFISNQIGNSLAADQSIRSGVSSRGDWMMPQPDTLIISESGSGVIVQTGKPDITVKVGVDCQLTRQ